MSKPEDWIAIDLDPVRTKSPGHGGREGPDEDSNTVQLVGLPTRDVRKRIASEYLVS
jgi:hypothetical protein